MRQLLSLNLLEIVLLRQEVQAHIERKGNPDRYNEAAILKPENLA